MSNVAFLILGVGFICWLLRWRSGKIELTEDKLIINGFMDVSIWLKNLWEIDVRELKWKRRVIRLDSKTDAVKIQFRTEKEFEDFSTALVKFTRQVENIKIQIS